MKITFSEMREMGLRVFWSGLPVAGCWNDQA